MAENKTQPSESKVQLQGLIIESISKSKRIQAKYDDGSRRKQKDIDVAEASLKVLPLPPPPGWDYTEAVNAWQDFNGYQDREISVLKSVNAELTTTSASGAGAAMAPYVKRDAVLPQLDPRDRGQAEVDITRLGAVLDTLADKNRVLLLLKSFGLDRPNPPEESPSKLLESAWAAYEKPVMPDAPGATALLALRGCISLTIGRFLRSRPKQEKCNGDYRMIISLGKSVPGMRLFRDEITDATIESLARRWANLANELSGRKVTMVPRSEIYSLLLQGTLWLGELLDSIDPRKLKPTHLHP